MDGGGNAEVRVRSKSTSAPPYYSQVLLPQCFPLLKISARLRGRMKSEAQSLWQSINTRLWCPRLRRRLSCLSAAVPSHLHLENTCVKFTRPPARTQTLLQSGWIPSCFGALLWHKAEAGNEMCLILRSSDGRVPDFLPAPLITFPSRPPPLPLPVMWRALMCGEGSAEPGSAPLNSPLPPDPWKQHGGSPDLGSARQTFNQLRSNEWKWTAAAQAQFTEAFKFKRLSLSDNHWFLIRKQSRCFYFHQHILTSEGLRFLALLLKWLTLFI